MSGHHGLGRVAGRPVRVSRLRLDAHVLISRLLRHGATVDGGVRLDLPDLGTRVLRRVGGIHCPALRIERTRQNNVATARSEGPAARGNTCCHIGRGERHQRVHRAVEHHPKAHRPVRLPAHEVGGQGSQVHPPPKRVEGDAVAAQGRLQSGRMLAHAAPGGS